MSKPVTKKVPWIVLFHCSDCSYREDILFMPGEVIIDTLTDKFCPMCGGILRSKYTGKDNSHKVHINDPYR